MAACGDDEMTVVLDASEGKVFVLEREIERLRDLLNDALFEISAPGCFSCKWCNSDSYKKSRHRPECPAFHPDGKVK